MDQLGRRELLIYRSGMYNCVSIKSCETSYLINGRDIQSHPYLLLGSRCPKAGVKMRLSLALNCCTWTWTLTCTDWTVPGCTCKVRASGMTPDIIYGPRSLDQRSTQLYPFSLSLLTKDEPLSYSCARIRLASPGICVPWCWVTEPFYALYYCFSRLPGYKPCLSPCCRSPRTWSQA
jgi:hypothetical protein